MPGVCAHARRAAFTIIEVLMVVAAVSVLVGLMLPSLGGARDSARQAACAAMQQQLAVGLLRYAVDHDEWIPGFNTSGYSLMRGPTPPAIEALSRHSDAPVQVNDWMSPALAGQALPLQREQRFHMLLEQFSCPSMALRAPVWIGGDQGSLAMADWIDEHAKEPAHGISYLMPTNFQLYGGLRVLDGPRGDVVLTQFSSDKFQELARVHRIRNDYRPRIDLIGHASQKIALADGFRYLGLRIIDFDASYSHRNWGSFTERSACDPLSRSWGRDGAGGTGYNLSVVYRHAHRINAAMWDGHVETLDERSSRNPSLWAPSRSRLMDPLGRLDPDSKTFGIEPSNDPRSLRNLID
jgi:prepilin-type processing-associated H-X9-DG protein